MSARPSRGRSADVESLRPTERRRFGRRLRSSARLARHMLGAPRRVLVSRRRLDESDVYGEDLVDAAPLLHAPAGLVTDSAFSNRFASRAPFTAVDMVHTPALVLPAEAVSSAEDPLVQTRLLTGEITMSRRLRFCLVNLCTIASLTLGITAIFAAMRHAPQTGAVLLLACVAFDGLDGALARRLGVSTPFGAQMDSLADMCSFGIATPVVAYAWLGGSSPAFVLGPICILVGVCSAIRLARFNITPKDGCHFQGVPTTMAATIIVVCALLMPDPVLIAPVALVAVLGPLMVSTFPYVKFSQARRIPLVVWVVPLALLVVNPVSAFLLVIGCYLLSGPMMWAKERRARVGTSVR